MPPQLLAICWFVPYPTRLQPHQKWFCPKWQNLCKISVLSHRDTFPTGPLACGASLLKIPATRGRLFLKRMMRDVLPLLLNILFTDAMHPTHSHACEDPWDTWNWCNFVCLIKKKCTKIPRSAPDCSRWSSQTSCGFIPFSCGTLCAFSKSLWAWDTKLHGHIPEHTDYCLHFHTVVHPCFLTTAN